MSSSDTLSPGLCKLYALFLALVTGVALWLTSVMGRVVWDELGRQGQGQVPGTLYAVLGICILTTAGALFCTFTLWRMARRAKAD